MKFLISNELIFTGTLVLRDFTGTDGFKQIPLDRQEHQQGQPNYFLHSQLDQEQNNKQQVQRPPALDNIIMKDCDFHLLTNITPDLLSTYTDLANHAMSDTLGSTDDSSLLAVPPSIVFNPKTSPSSRLKSSPFDETTLNDRTFESFPVDNLDHSNHSYASSCTLDNGSLMNGFTFNDKYINDQVQHCRKDSDMMNKSFESSNRNATNYFTINENHHRDMSPRDFNTPKSHGNRSPALNITESDGHVIKSESRSSPDRETMSTIGHGSGGTVTILKNIKFSSSGVKQFYSSDTSVVTNTSLTNGVTNKITQNQCEELAEPLARLLSPQTPPDANDPVRLSGPTRRLQGTALTLQTSRQAAIQVGQITGSGILHSDDEEITDDFNWDKLI